MEGELCELKNAAAKVTDSVDRLLGNGNVIDVGSDVLLSRSVPSLGLLRDRGGVPVVVRWLLRLPRVLAGLPPGGLLISSSNPAVVLMVPVLPGMRLPRRLVTRVSAVATGVVRLGFHGALVETNRTASKNDVGANFLEGD